MTKKYQWTIRYELVNAETKMQFEEELKDIEKAYKSAVLKASQEITQMMPGFLCQMKYFISLHEKHEEFLEKLVTLRRKMDQESNDFGDDSEHNECGECKDNE